MTQEEKDLLLKDLCGRLPYGIKINYQNYSYPLSVSSISGETIHHTSYFVCGNIEVKSHKIEEIKPYLRPMSSMTDEEIYEFALISDTVFWLGNKRSTCILSLEQMDWLNAHHFDYRGLIEKGLALEAPEGMYE